MACHTSGNIDSFRGWSLLSRDVHDVCCGMMFVHVSLILLYFSSEPLNPSITKQRLVIHDSVFLTQKILAKFQLVHLQQGRQIGYILCTKKIMIFLAVYWKWWKGHSYYGTIINMCSIRLWPLKVILLLVSLVLAINYSCIWPDGVSGVTHLLNQF